MNILIVDDQPVNRKLLRATLEAEGHGVVQASDGVEALELLKKRSPDAIISDILMPRMDGYRLCREVRAHDQFNDLPFIMYTSTYVSPSDEKLSLDLGADVFMRKPAPAKEIIKTLCDVTSRDRKPRSASHGAMPEADVMKEYSGRLVAKLEQKNQELAQALQELSGERSRLKHLLEHSPAVIYTLKIDGERMTPVVVSENIERLLGVSVAESKSYQWWLGSLHPKDRDRVLEVLRKSLTQGGYSTEYRIRHKDGSYHWVEDNNRVVCDETGQPVESVGVWTDITERKESEELVRDQADMLNRAHDSIVIRDFKDKRIIFWNKGAQRIFGWTEAEALGRNIEDLIYIDPKERAEGLKVLLEKGEFRGELKQRTKDGRDLIGEVRVSLIRNDDGTPRAVLSIGTDITEKKKLETQLLRAQRLESIGTLASGVAHDLNNILTPILMCSEALRHDPAPEDIPSTISLIEESARRGASIVKQVLTFARGVEGERVLIKPSHLIEEMVDIAHKTFPKVIDINARYPEDLWSIQADPTQLHQVLLNLAVNARDAMPTGGALTFAAENFFVDEHYAAMTADAEKGPYIVLRVSDTGSGMPRATVDKIFDPFFTTKDVGKGTGLGLSTALGIVKSHGGFISVYSEISKGTTFKLFLPATMSDEDLRKSEASVAPIRGNGEQLLVVDDEANILQITRMIFEKHNYRVLSASDGPEALALFAQQMDSIDGVLTDIAMPYMDGVALVRALRKMKPNVPIIASTGQEDQPGITELRSLGVKNFLAKPYDTDKLLRTLRAAMESKELAQYSQK